MNCRALRLRLAAGRARVGMNHVTPMKWLRGAHEQQREQAR